MAQHQVNLRLFDNLTLDDQVYFVACALAAHRMNAPAWITEWMVRRTPYAPIAIKLAEQLRLPPR